MKKGFTLAEVLITLGIIGVVSAMTLPTVIENYKKQKTVSQLKKVYTTLNQALKLSETQNGEYANWDNASDIGAKEYFDKYWKPYLKVVKVCESYVDCNYENIPWKYNNGTSFAYNFMSKNSRIPFFTIDGVLINIFVLSGVNLENIDNKIIVDLNGGLPPNTFGKDVFLFLRTEKGIIYPYGYNTGTNSINSNCKHNGTYCSAKIMQDGWKISDDYPW